MMAYVRAEKVAAQYDLEDFARDAKAVMGRSLGR
jgi:hypothetical protein